jgi:hypothetical protein
MSSPRLVVELPFEGPPIVYVVAFHEGDETRLADWICSNSGGEAVLTVAQRAIQRYIDEWQAGSR